MSLINYLRVLGGRWRIVAVTCVVGLVAGWITSPGAGPVATGQRLSTTHTLIVEPGTSDARGEPADASSLDVIVLLVQQGDVPARAAEALAIDVTELGAKVQATTEPGVVRITAADTDPAEAARIANTVATELLEVLAEQQQERFDRDLNEANALVAALQDEIDGSPTPAGGQNSPEQQRLDAAIEQVQTLESQGPPDPTLITLEEASPTGAVPAGTDQPEASPRRAGGNQGATGATDTEASSQVRAPEDPPNRAVRMLIGGMFGLLLGVGLALLRERLDARIRSKEAAEAAFGLPVLAEIPRLTRSQRKRAEVASAANGGELQAEAYRVLRTAVLFRSTLARSAGARSAGQRRRDGRSSAGFSPTPELIEGVEDLAHAGLGLPVLGTIPPLGAGASPTGRPLPTGPKLAAQVDRALQSFQGGAGVRGEIHTLQVTSAVAGEGKTTAAAHLAIEIARAGRRVTVVDCNLDDPQLHQCFELSNEVGLTSVVSGEVNLSAVRRQVMGEERLLVVASGPLPPDPYELLSSARTAEVLAALALQCDILILDTSAVLAADDAIVLAKLADASVVVAGGGMTSGAQLQHAVETLSRAGVPMLGTVLNRTQGAAPVRQDARTKEMSDDASIDRPAMVMPNGEAGPNARIQVLLITSPGNAEGKTSTVVNLAAAMAEASASVLALDFDLRRPQVHQYFREAPQPGLTDVLDPNGNGPALAEVLRATPLSRLRVALSGSPATSLSELLPKGQRLVAVARHHADVILIDTPPVLAASDASQLAPAADGVVIACRAGKTTVDGALRCVEQLGRLGAPLLGVVLLATPANPVARSYYSTEGAKRQGRQRGAGRGKGSETSPAMTGAPGSDDRRRSGRPEKARAAKAKGDKAARRKKAGKKTAKRAKQRL